MESKFVGPVYVPDVTIATNRFIFYLYRWEHYSLPIRHSWV